jgi:hypothetical protein
MRLSAQTRLAAIRSVAHAAIRTNTSGGYPLCACLRLSAKTPLAAIRSVAVCDTSGGYPRGYAALLCACVMRLPAILGLCVRVCVCVCVCVCE